MLLVFVNRLTTFGIELLIRRTSTLGSWALYGLIIFGLEDSFRWLSWVDRRYWTALILDSLHSGDRLGSPKICSWVRLLLHLLLL
jgi:hypothetical protein